METVLNKTKKATGATKDGTSSTASAVVSKKSSDQDIRNSKGSDNQGDRLANTNQAKTVSVVKAATPTTMIKTKKNLNRTTRISKVKHLCPQLMVLTEG